MGSWGRGASGGMSQSLIGAGNVGGGGATREKCSNLFQSLLEDDSRPYDSGKASFSGPSNLGDPPQSGRGGSEDYQMIPEATKSAFFPAKDGHRALDSFRSQNTSQSFSFILCCKYIPCVNMVKQTGCHSYLYHYLMVHQAQQGSGALQQEGPRFLLLFRVLHICRIPISIQVYPVVHVVSNPCLETRLLALLAKHLSRHLYRVKYPKVMKVCNIVFQFRLEILSRSWHIW